jgi:phytoene dehydrogenase-like protein
VLVLEKRDHAGGAAVSERPWEGVDARLSRYSYLVSLLPHAIVEELGLPIELRRRTVSSYTPRPDGSGLLVSAHRGPHKRWDDFYAMTSRVGQAVFPTLTEPLMTREQLRARVGEDEAWEALVDRPLSETLERWFEDDLERGIVLTDALIGTFARADEETLRQNRCFLYHVIGNGTGMWDVPVGGMGAVTDALAQKAWEAGAEVRADTEVTRIETDGERAQVFWEGGVVEAEHVLANVAPTVLARLLDEPAPRDQPEGAQLKVNFLLSRLPALKDPNVAPSDAFAGTFHVNESYAQLAHAYACAADGQFPEVAPCEIYCHSLTDPSILGADLRRAGAHTLTCFVLHMPARLFRANPEAAKAERSPPPCARSTACSPSRSRTASGSRPPASRASRPRRRSSSRPNSGCRAATSSTATSRGRSPRTRRRRGLGRRRPSHPNVFICGAGARRGGGVSGSPGTTPRWRSSTAFRASELKGDSPL